MFTSSLSSKMRLLAVFIPIMVKCCILSSAKARRQDRRMRNLEDVSQRDLSLLILFVTCDALWLPQTIRLYDILGIEVLFARSDGFQHADLGGSELVHLCQE